MSDVWLGNVSKMNMDSLIHHCRCLTTKEEYVLTVVVINSIVGRIEGFDVSLVVITRWIVGSAKHQAGGNEGERDMAILSFIFRII